MCAIRAFLELMCTLVAERNEYWPGITKTWTVLHSAQFRPVEKRIHREFQWQARDECLSVESFSSLNDARQKLAIFRELESAPPAQSVLDWILGVCSVAQGEC